MSAYFACGVLDRLGCLADTRAEESAACVVQRPADGPALADLCGLVPCDSQQILVVDDDEHVRCVFESVLRHAFADFRVEAVGNGAEAVKAFEQRHHAVVLMDLCMPVMDGRQAFGNIMDLCREKGWLPPSVVFCTGFAPPSSVSRAVASDPRHCLLSKPIGADLLTRTVRSRLS